MRGMPRAALQKIISIVFAGLLSASFASAQTPSSSGLQALIKQLQEQVKSLQAQVQTLTSQFAATKEETTAVKAEVKAAHEEIKATKEEVAVIKEEFRLTKSLKRGERGDEVRKLQEFLSQFPDIYSEKLITGFFGPATEAAVRKLQAKHGIEQVGSIGPKTLSKINELLTEGAGKSGVIPPGLVRVAGIAGASLLATTTLTHTAATTTAATLCPKDPKYCANKEACASANFYWYTVSCHKDPPPGYSCAASYNYCISPTECAAQGWYSCRNSCYPSAEACQGQAYVPPATAAAIPAISAQPVAQTGTTTVSATPAIPLPSSPSPTQVPASGWTINTVSAQGYDPSLAWDGSGYGVVWASVSNYAGVEIYFARLDANGTKIGGDLRLSNGTGQAGNPTIAWNGTEYGVVWSDKRGGVWSQLNFARVSAAGVKIGGDTYITTHAIGHSGSPILLWIGSEYGLFWDTSAYTSNYEVYFTRLSASGTKLISDTRITFNGIGNTSGLSAVWTGSEYGVVWGFPVASQPAHVYFQRVSVQGAPIGTPLRLSIVTASYPSTAIGWTGSAYGVAWMNYQNIATSPLIFVSVSAQGVLQGTPTTLEGTRVVSQPSIVWGNSAFGVLSPDQRSSGTLIYFSQLGSDGVRQTSDMQITPAGTASWDPKIIFDGRSYAAVWEGDSSYGGGISFAKSPAVALAISATPVLPATDATPPSSPTNLTATSSATSASSAKIILTWTLSTDNVGVSGYKIYRNGTFVANSASTSPNGTASFTEYGLALATAYSYTVAAYDAVGNVSAQSNPLSATTPSSPSPYGSALNFNNVSDLFGKIWGPGSNGIILGGGLNFSTQVGIGWAQQYGGKYVTAYSIQGVSSNYLTQTNSVNVSVTGPAGSIIEVWDLETLTVVATNISSPGSPTMFTALPNHRYGGFGWYADNSQKNIEIRATLSSSSPTPDTTPPVISNIQASSITATSTVITWTTDEASDSQVEWGGTSSYGAVATNPSLVASHSIPFSGLALGTTYHYRVKSKDQAGNQATSADQTFTTTSPSPSPTVDLKWGTTTTGPWYDGTLTIAASANYYLYWTTTNSPTTCSPGDWWSQSGDKNASGGSWNFIGVAVTGLKTYSLTCSHAYGSMTDTVYVDVTSTPPDTTPPSIPTNLTAKEVPSPLSSPKIDLSWSASTDSVGVTGYYLYREGASYLVPATTLSYSDYNSGLVQGMTYHYTVSARDATGNNSAQSSPVSVTTATTTSSLDSRAKNLAAIGHALDAIKEKLLLLLQEL